MTQAAAMPFVQIREFGDDAKLLAGGRIWFYELGSTTPKTVWTDIAMTTPATNPVVLSASGSAKIFCDGAYSYKIERFVSGVYVEQQTGDFTTVTGGDTSLAIFQDYDALEASDGTALVAAVIDGFNAGDKAGGIFFRDNSQATITTDGVVVVGPTFKYVRAYSNTINAEWCGVQWNGLAQGSAVNRALGASIAYGQPVFFDLPFQIQQTIQVQAGASVIFGDQCRISGSIVVNWNFTQGSQLVSCAPGAFGPNVRPRFDTGVYEFLRLSWCKGATDDETLAQFLGMPNTDFYTVVVDKSLDDVRTNFTLPGKTSARFEGGRIRFTTGACSVSINAWETPPLRQVFEFTFASVIGSIALPEPARPEWFGAVGNGVADDSIPMLAAIRSRRVYIGAYYLYKPQNIAETYCEFTGAYIPEIVAGALTLSPGIKFETSGQIIFSGSVTADGVAFSKATSGEAILCNGFNAFNCAFSSPLHLITANRSRVWNSSMAYAANARGVAGEQIYVACYIIDTASLLTDTPITSINNARLASVASAEMLYTTSDGDIAGIDAASTRTIDLSAATMKVATSRPTRQILPPLYVTTGATLAGANSLVKLTGFAAAATITLPSHTGRDGQFIQIIADHQSISLELFGVFVNGLSSITIGRLNSSTSAAALVIATAAGWDLLEGA